MDLTKPTSVYFQKKEFKIVVKTSVTNSEGGKRTIYNPQQAQQNMLHLQSKYTKFKSSGNSFLM